MRAFLDALAFFGRRGAAPVWPPRRLSLALQGGGSFGAFTWGALERLLELDVDFDAISGVSAGAVNAVLLAAGLMDGGREGAKARLERFWRRMSRVAALTPSASLGRLPFGLMTGALSPYLFNPFNLNPLREALIEEVDFARLRTHSPIRLLIGATRVSDGSLRVFSADEVSADVVLASACLPLIHHTIEIEGEPYWDGGYSANPPLLALAAATRADHILVVQATPSTVDRLPTTPHDIARRLERIQFNATLNAELAALRYGKLVGATPKLRRLRVGRISAQDEFAGLADESAGNLGWDFLERLRQGGRAAVENWFVDAEPPAPRRTLAATLARLRGAAA
ncbi:MAG: patatin-like phospholipase family protein [Bradyrhizobium sp.]|nr:MAG: patatin-like phospholipase family protein [Bradyrhizobium sp.]